MMGPPMTKADQKMLFMALGFLSMLIPEGIPVEKRASGARCMASLIEEFCRWSVPEAFDEAMERSDDGYTPPRVDHLIETFKISELKDKERALPNERGLLLMMHKHLEERANNRARAQYPDDLLKILICKLVKDEDDQEKGRAS